MQTNRQRNWIWRMAMVGMAIGHMWQLTHQAPCIMAHKATRYASLRIHCPSRLALRLLNTKTNTQTLAYTWKTKWEKETTHSHTQRHTDTLYICTHCYCCYKLRIKNTSKIRNPKEIHTNTHTHTYRQRRHTAITEAAAAQRSSSLSSRQLKQSFSEASSSGDNNSDSVTRAAKSAAWK